MGQPQKGGISWEEFPKKEEKEEKSNSINGVVPDFFIYSIIMLSFLLF